MALCGSFCVPFRPRRRSSALWSQSLLESSRWVGWVWVCGVDEDKGECRNDSSCCCGLAFIGCSLWLKLFKTRTDEEEGGDDGVMRVDAEAEAEAEAETGTRAETEANDEVGAKEKEEGEAKVDEEEEDVEWETDTCLTLVVETEREEERAGEREDKEEDEEEEDREEEMVCCLAESDCDKSVGISEKLLGCNLGDSFSFSFSFSLSFSPSPLSCCCI
jgi:hypothetical protein